MKNIVITPITFEPVYAQQVEIVERKGTGHPDTICDYLAEELSVALCKWYEENFGRLCTTTWIKPSWWAVGQSQSLVEGK